MLTACEINGYDMLVDDFVVDPSAIGMNAIRATRRAFYGDKQVVKAMPRAVTSSGKIFFFQIRQYIPVSQIVGETTKRGLVLADPHTLAAYNKANSDFVTLHPNGTQWIGENGKVCYATFRRSDDKCNVHVSRDDGGWLEGWWFAGFRSSDLST
jgi:hypothetical protein